MDFAFVPGTTKYEQRLQRMMQTRKPKTTLVSKSGVATVVDFLKELEAENVTAAGDLVLGAHAAGQSAFVMPFDTPLDPDHPVRADYEKVEALNSAGTIHIPSGVKGPTTSVHLKGCRLGKTAQPVLELMKTAFDNPLQVTAPLYFHGLSDFAGQGIFEYMTYGYEVTAPDPFVLAERKDLLAAFQSDPQRFKQGVEKGELPEDVPSANFDRWLPTQKELDSLFEVLLSGELLLKKLVFRVAPPVVRKDPATGNTVNVPTIKNAYFRALTEHFTWYIDMSNKTIPSDDAGRMALLKPDMLSNPLMEFPKVRPYPYYLRFGFDNFESFFNAFHWSVSQVTKDSKPVLEYMGLICIYRLSIPIVKKGTNDVIFNYYPNSGMPIMNFREDNATYDLFGIV